MEDDEPYMYPTGFHASTRTVMAKNEFKYRERANVLSRFFSRLRYVIKLVENRDVRFEPTLRQYADPEPARNTLYFGFNSHEDRDVIPVLEHEMETSKVESHILYWRTERDPYRSSWLCWQNYSMKLSEPNCIVMLVRDQRAPLGVDAIAFVANQYNRYQMWNTRNVEYKLETPGRWLDIVTNNHKSDDGWWSFGVEYSLDAAHLRLREWKRHDLLEPRPDKKPNQR